MRVYTQSGGVGEPIGMTASTEAINAELDRKTPEELFAFMKEIQVICGHVFYRFD